METPEMSKIVSYFKTEYLYARYKLGFCPIISFLGLCPIWISFPIIGILAFIILLSK
jgi:hypothetical protein